jgi:hypothetical protein
VRTSRHVDEHLRETEPDVQRRIEDPDGHFLEMLTVP